MRPAIDWFTRRRNALDSSLGGWTLHHYSPATLSQYRAVEPVLRQYARGRIIDLGSGNSPYRSLLESLGSEYHTLDVRRRSGAGQLTYVGDIQDMRLIASGSYDTAVCLEVLEHVPRPWLAMAEISRVLAAGGSAVVTVPHLSRLHEAPDDYFRFTEYALRHLAVSAGLEVLVLRPRGGLLSFLGHQLSSVLLVLLGGPRAARSAVALGLFAALSIPCTVLDSLFGDASPFPLGYVAAMRKPNTLEH